MRRQCENVGMCDVMFLNILFGDGVVFEFLDVVSLGEINMILSCLFSYYRLFATRLTDQAYPRKVARVT